MLTEKRSSVVVAADVTSCGSGWTQVPLAIEGIVRGRNRAIGKVTELSDDITGN
jgi:hypothetical protein